MKHHTATALLLESGANLNTTDKVCCSKIYLLADRSLIMGILCWRQDGMTALMFSFYYMNDTATALLLEKGAIVNVKDKVIDS